MKTSIGLIIGFLLCYLPLRSQDNPAVSYIQHVSIDYSEPNIVYAASRGQGLFKSTDYGESWVLKYDAAQGRNFNVILPDPKTPERVFAGGQGTGLLLSTDKGETWKIIGLEGETINDLAIDRNNPRRIFVLANQGVFSNQNIDKEPWVLCFNYRQYLRDSVRLDQDAIRRASAAISEKSRALFAQEGSPDAAAAPERSVRQEQGSGAVAGQQARQMGGGFGRFKKLGLSPFHPNTLIVGAGWEGGFYRTDDGGRTWRHETVSGIFRRIDVVYFHQSDPNIIYVATHHQGIFKTFNFGKSWIPLSDGLGPQIREPYYGAFLISGFAVDKTNPDNMYSGSDFSNWKTTDGGKNWSELDKTLTCEFVRGMAVDPVHPNIVYAGSNVGMYKSTDAGKSWSAVNNGFQQVTIKKTIQVQSGKEKFQYALSENYPFVYRKAEGGTWTSMNWLLPSYFVKTATDLYFDDAKKELVLVADNGTYVSKDYGFRWIGEKPLVVYEHAKSEVKELKLDRPDFAKNYVLAVQLNGEVLFDDSLVSPLYQKPPYISLQLVEVGYPDNGSVPAWSMNIDDCLKATVEIPKSAVDPGKKYYVYAEVRDFQKNYRTAFSKITFGDQIIPVSMELQDGFCLKK